MLSTQQLRSSPVHDRLQLAIVRSAPGLAVLSMPLADELKGFFDGTVHGGVLATLADAACASCLEGCYEFPAQFTVTTDMHVRYYRQPKAGPLTAEAVLVHKGRRLLSSECSITDATSRVLVRSTATYMIIDSPSS